MYSFRGNFTLPPSTPAHQRPFSIFSSIPRPNHQRVFLPLRHPRPETWALCERTADFRLTFSTAGFFSLPKAPTPSQKGWLFPQKDPRSARFRVSSSPSILSFEYCFFSFFLHPFSISSFSLLLFLSSFVSFLLGFFFPSWWKVVEYEG